MNRASILHAMIAGLAFGFSACTEPAENPMSSGTPDLLRRGNVEEPETLDPALAVDVHAFNILIDLYEGLVAEDASGDLVPGVADSWTVSDDGLQYTFTLRPTARWSNGEPVVAGEFVNGLQRVASPHTDSAYSFLLEPIENFSGVKGGAMKASDLGVLAIDDQTLVIRLSTPAAQFPGVLAMPVAFPLYGAGDDPARFQQPATFVGNGPYVLSQREVGRPIRLNRNTHYWDAAAVAISMVDYVPIVDEVAELNMYRSGELDFTATIPPSHFEIVNRELPEEVRVAPSLALYYLAFDLTEAPLDEPLLRQALSMAIDREQLVTLLGRGEQAAYGIVPPGVANYNSAGNPWRDLETAERHRQALDLLRRAGYGDDKPLQLKLTYDVGGIHEQVALSVRSMWQESLGIEVELEKKEWKYFLDTRDNRADWQIMRFAWFGDYNDAMTFAEIFRSDSLQNLPKYANPEYDMLLRAATAQTDPRKRTDLLRQAEQTLIGDHPIAPLYFYVSKHLVKPYVHGFEHNVLDRHPSKYLSFQSL